MPGIINLESAWNWALTLGKTLGADLKDKKFTFSELSGLLFQLLMIQDLLAKKDEIIDEAKHLTLDGIKKLVQDAETIITNADVVAVIESALNSAISVIALIEAVKKVTHKPTPPPTT